MAGYADVGDALFALVNTLDISSVLAGGWVGAFNHPVKQIDDWPAFAVVPATDANADLDSVSDEVDYTWWVFLYYSFNDATTAEGSLRKLADLLASRIRKEKRATPPLGLPAAYALGSLNGSWGYDEEHGLRFFRLDVQIKVDQPLT